jgi:serine/threonine-protein kinase
VRTLAAVAVTLAVGLSSAAARAQSVSDQATAEALFKQARDLMTAGHFGEACPKLAESERLDPSAGTMLNLATCYEKNGQLASAWVTFKGAATGAQNANEKDRAKLARAKVAELEPKLATLSIAVDPAADVPGLVVKRDGEPVGRAGWGTAVPVDPGAHTVEASAPGRRPWQSQAVVEGPAAKASIVVPPLAVDTSPPVPAPPAPGTPPPVPPPAAPPSTPGSTQRVLGVVTASVGLAGIAVGSIFGVLAKGHQNDAGPHCSGTECDVTGISDLGDARTAATVSTIGFIAGGALLAGGVVLYLVAPRGSPGTGLLVAPGSDGSVAGLTLRGGW